jgi:tRNA threonylcarbamoyladenosine biosynthesis protein TsaB
MKILAIETSGRTFSVALNEYDKTVASFYYDQGNIHSEMIIPVVERLLKDTRNTFESIDKFAVSIGPGSFTGIRVGITAVKTFAQILNKPVVPINTLLILEKSFIKTSEIKIVPAIDALRDEVYVKVESNGTIIPCQADVTIKNIDKFIKDLKKYKDNLLIIGNAAIVHKEKLSRELGEYSVSLPYIMHMPKAQILATLAYHFIENSVDYTEIEQLYIRNPWTEKK